MKVLIGIPAHNEEKNIANIICDIQKQKVSNNTGISLMILSDSSTDNTLQIATKIAPTAIIRKTHSQKGKTFCVKEMIDYGKKNNFQILIIIDADLRLSNQCISYLLRNIDGNTLFVSGNPLPEDGNSFIEQIGLLNDRIFRRLHQSLNKKLLFHMFSEQFFAINLPLIESNDIIDNVPFFDEAYYYLAQKKHLKALIDSHSIVYYKLPSSINDYIIQLRRFITNSNSARKLFKNNISDATKTHSPFHLLLYLLIEGCSHPITALAYIFIHAFAKVSLIFYPVKFNTKWSPVQTTKFFNK